MSQVVLYQIVYILILAIVPSNTGLNNLHFIDGTSTAEIIAGDVFFEITDPVELEYTYRIRPAKDFGAPFNESYIVKNAALVPIIPKYGSFIERGECSFKKKSLIAEQAGARAVIITDISKANEEYFIEMIDDDSEGEVHIPAAFLMGKNGLMITKTLERLQRQYAIINLPVNLTFTPAHKMNQPPWLGW
ncbi:hypothetical protein WA026_011518 [Henosepilachna vigintioctopunctata]|uniref:PA domain-containing protein n=1 Tax=Henosepilachna vigintioctopunctata TaxID=420089 RepID=A0AAW1TRD9_9CUCU